MPSPRWIAGGLLVAAALALGACTRTSDQNAPSARSGFDPAAPWTGYPSRDPRNTVLSFWRLVQIGAYPAAAVGYDPRARAAIGNTAFLDVLELERLGVAALKPTAYAVRRLPRGTVVDVRTRGEHSRGAAFSFQLVRRDGRWYIVYDSLIGDTLAAALANVLQRDRDPGEGVSAAAVRKAVRRARAYRANALRLLLGPEPAGQ